MVFGKIDYLNLLPFHVFLKRSTLTSYTKKTIEFKKGVPSKLNRDLRARRVDAAVISSAESYRKRYKKLNFGIVAKSSVKSVLVRKNSPAKLDPASASSNLLAQILDVQGEVIIGDRALRAYLGEGANKFNDLAAIWHERTGLPFVFGRFSCTSGRSFYARLTLRFLRAPIKIPGYILAHYAATREISPKDIKWYLGFISYRISVKEKKSLALFFRKARALRFEQRS